MNYQSSVGYRAESRGEAGTGLEGIVATLREEINRQRLQNERLTVGLKEANRERQQVTEQLAAKREGRKVDREAMRDILEQVDRAEERLRVVLRELGIGSGPAGVAAARPGSWASGFSYGTMQSTTAPSIAAGLGRSLELEEV